MENLKIRETGWVGFYEYDLSHIICVSEPESFFETHRNLLKFVRARIENANSMRGRAQAPDILKDYVTKCTTRHIFD